MRICLLGPLEVRGADGAPVALAGARLRTLLIRLALDPGRVVTHAALVDAVWPDDPPANTANALQALVSRLRRAVPGLEIEPHPAGYRLILATDDLDVTVFEKLRAAGDLDAALALWRGPALAEVAGADFARGTAARLTEQLTSAREERLAAAGDHADLAEIEELVAAHPLRERPVLLLMRVLRARGRAPQALAAYERLRAELDATLGTDPSPELAALHVEILRDTGPAAPTASGLPAGLTSFVGRERELVRVTELAAGHRLVTLTGPGGTGKTRLSVEVARDLAGRLPGGVALVELAAVTEPDQVPYAVAAALGLRDQSALSQGVRPAARRDATERLADALANRQALIVLDNCEHLLEAAAHLAAVLLAACPRLRIIATSREPLGVLGEALWPVLPLAVPPPGAGPDEAAGYPAMRLLVERAMAGRPDFVLDDGNTAAMTVLCRALDGVPLAIELAAARLRTLPPEQLAARLGDRFRLLSGGNRTALPRHQTLRAVVDWSWDLLTPAEQAVWRRLSVFAGGATLAAAEAACAELGSDTVDVLAALVDKSILRLSGDRYQLLETIREYGLDRLDESGEHGAAVRAHSAYFLELAETAEPLLRRAEQVTWLRRLRADHDNLLVALRRALHARDAELSVRLAAALGWYWWLSGHRAEGGHLGAEAMALDGPAPGRARAVACAAAALNLIEGTGDVEQVRALFEQAVALAERAPGEHPLLALIGPAQRLMTVVYTDGNWFSDGAPTHFARLFDHPEPWVAATARAFHAHAALNLGQSHVEATVDFIAALDVYRRIGDRWGMALVLEALSTLETQRGAYGRAADAAGEAIALLTELGTTDDLVTLQLRLAQARWLDGRLDEAVVALNEAQVTADRHGSPVNLAALAYAWSNLHRVNGEIDQAWERVEQAEGLVRELAVAPQFRAVMASAKGQLAGARGDLAAAREHHTRALEHALSAVDSPVVGHTLVGCADLALREGDPALAATLLGAARAVNGAVDHSLVDLPAIEQAARSALDEQTFAAAYQRGQAADMSTVRALTTRAS
ncbi:BTAD domain-containing putative transcriptional regulator [Catellatospora tritici]|uniref:BTAD domain-containing putative transcriptional regulator n=1 Tax=Catellatospora tritici TaxID=2851566 RepID=UPI001C2D52C2|nr:BTAD domain-containing putative transcriptional regulator [Catellatospora tritici]MBV1848784.1 winged helix-turn-helix domain-containing protein [Catellatospora tritici]